MTETRFAKVGDAHVAYRTWGEGPIDLLYFEEIPVDMLDDEPRLARALKRLASIGRVVAFNPRGLGLSDALGRPGAPTMEERYEDALAVVEAVEASRVVCLGFAFMGATAIDFAARTPDRTSALVLFNAWASWLWHEDYPFGTRLDEAERIAKAIVDPNPPERARATIPHPAESMKDDEGFQRWWLSRQPPSQPPNGRGHHGVSPRDRPAPRAAAHHRADAHHSADGS